jgi:hypothetical protein
MGKKRTTTDPARERVRELYGFDFPDDFFGFREFLAGLPRELLAEALDMRPAYPFEAADGRRPTDHPAHPLWEDRYYNDPPEFVTLFDGGTDGLHWGYHFDDPGRAPPVVAHYYSRDAYDYGQDGDDLFEAVRSEIESAHGSYLLDRGYDPEHAEEYDGKLAGLAELRTALSRVWGAERKEVGDAYRDKWGLTARVPTAPTWEGMGVVVPKERHRPLKTDPFGRKPGLIEPKPKIIPKAAEEALRLVADGYPGAALKLGRELWVFADHFETSYQLLDAAYEALGREPLQRLLAAARGWREHCDAQRKLRG